MNQAAGTVSGSFTVGNVPPGQYVVRVTDSAGNFAEAFFLVKRAPTLFLNTTSGPIGTHVNFKGVNFTLGDTSCSVSSPTSSAIVIAAACVMVQNSTHVLANVNGSFTVGNVPPGQYVIQVTGSPIGDFAQAIFNVTLGPRLVLTPSSGPTGSDVSFAGFGFLPQDSGCSLSASISGLFSAGTCVKRWGSTMVNGSFTIGVVPPGEYFVRVIGTPYSDFADAIFNVTFGPRIVLAPINGHIGDHVSVNGTGFLPQDSSCTIVSGPSNIFNPILPGSVACAIFRVGTGIVNGSFIIGNVPPGQYVIQVNGNLGDSAQAILTVLASAPTLILYPANATNGAAVSFRGTGFSASDTGCVVQASPNNLVITSPTCSIVSPTVAVGSFIVGPYATTNVKWNVTVKGTPANDIPGPPTGAIFNVTASIVVTPPSGTINTVFTFTGSGFSSTATSCAATIIPPFPSGSSHPSCYLSTGAGQVSGSIIVPTTAVPGTYGISVGAYVAGVHTGQNATGFFTVGTPSALITLTPGSVGQGQPVGVAGVGFNPNDTLCKISAGTPNVLFTSSTCSISGGYVSGAFTVASTAPGGYYLVTVTGYISPANVTRGDFASNFLAVTLSSTVTTFSTTTTTASTTTKLSTTTTSVATSYSYSSTTYSTTGILFTTYSHLTVNTVSGLTSITLTATTSTTQTLTTVTVSTTTAFTTVACTVFPCGYSIGSQGMNPGPFADNIGLLAVLLLVLPMLLRRLFS